MRLLSRNAALLLSRFLASPLVPHYGYELMQETGIKSGSLYPVLGRFERLGWISGQKEEPVGNRPPRRVYTMNPDSVADAQAALDRFLEASRANGSDLESWGLA